MSIKNKSQLKADVASVIRSGGVPTKTRAAEVRTLLTDLIDSGINTINGVQPDASGNIAGLLTADQVYVVGAVPFTEQQKLTDPANWVNREYAGPALTYGEAGDCFCNSDYVFQCMGSQYWVRVARV